MIQNIAKNQQYNPERDFWKENEKQYRVAKLWKGLLLIEDIQILWQYIMFTVNDLIEAFDNNLIFAWELLHAEIMLETNSVNTDHLKSLLILYSKAIQKFSTSRLPNEHYFKIKINQLMGQKKVINCLQTEQKTKLTSNKKDTKQINQLQHIQVPKLAPIPLDRELQTRKQDLELRVAYSIEESKNGKVSQMLQQQASKAQKIKGIVMSCISKEEQRLLMKLARRQSRVSASRKMTQSVGLSRISTEGQAQGVGNCSLNDISFTSDVDSDL